MLTILLAFRHPRPTALVVAALAAVGASASAQMPAAPVLQNAWANAGITVAANYGRAGETQALAGALAWAPAQSRFQLSAGAGIVRPDSGDSFGGYGGRLSVPIRDFVAGRLGTAIFGGFGVAATKGARESNFPAGVAVGYRHALGATRGISAYVAPFVVIARRTVSDTAPPDTPTSSTLFRASAGIDITILPQLGLTIGYEGGANAKENEPGSRTGAFGVAVSYALRRQP